MEDKLSIKVNIAERSYPLKIDRNEEERIRKAAKMIGEKILKYKQRYPDKDNQDILAMVALQFVTQSLENEVRLDHTGFMNHVKDITRELDEYLTK